MRELPARRWCTAAVALAIGVASAGCAEGSIGPALGPPVVSTIAPVESGSAHVSARDNEFIKSEVAVAVGTEVVWKNDGRAEHNIVAADPAAGFKVEQAKFGPKAEYHFTFKTPGVYRYFCSIHGTAEKGMTGVVQVVAPQDGSQR